MPDARSSSGREGQAPINTNMRDDKQITQKEPAPLSLSPIANLAKVRERILAGLRVGKQSPEYKRTKAVIDQLIALVTVALMGLDE